MSSFTRQDYQKVYDFALHVINYFESRSLEEREAIEVMDLCEEVLGQQSNRPDWSRLQNAG